MDTSSVTVRYRPIRIGWAIKSGDFEAYRRAVRYSYALWGGRFNPIVMVDRPEADMLIEKFRVDTIMPIGDHQDIADFVDKHAYLRSFVLGRDEPVFVKGSEHVRSYARVLDMENAFWHLNKKPELEDIKKRDVKLFNWTADDPMTDVLLGMFGAYPDVEEVGIDYKGRVVASAGGRDFNLSKDAPIQAGLLETPSIPFLCRMAIESTPYYRGRWTNTGGFYLGDSRNLDDLVHWWNLRAADLPLMFVDESNLPRYSEIIPKWYGMMGERVMMLRPEYRHIDLWTRDQEVERIRNVFGDQRLLLHGVDDATWSGYSVMPPIMHFGQGPVLGLIGGDDKRVSVTFQLPAKPYSDKPWFSDQHLAVSVWFIGGLYRHHMQTLQPPYVPELNQYFGNRMHYGGDTLRVERESVATLVDVHTDECTFWALPQQELIVQFLKLAGYDATPSAAGLSTRQLVTNMGGIGRADAFKIPGVRKLLDTYGPNESFTKRSAFSLINAKGDVGRPGLSFKDFENMYVEPGPRKNGEKLAVGTVFGHLVERKLFRVGVDLLCPNCQIKSWHALERIHDRVTCELCGHHFEPQRQLADDNEHAYRRSGILGLERNTHGAIPVLLTLAYLMEEGRDRALRKSHCCLSLNLKRIGVEDDDGCESDFVWVEDGGHLESDLVSIALSECKTKGPIEAKDIENLKRVALAFPENRFKAYVILAKIAPFTDEELALAKQLNDEGNTRAILLWGRELELTHLQRLREQKKEPMVVGRSLAEMARKTHELYFKAKQGHEQGVPM